MFFIVTLLTLAACDQRPTLAEQGDRLTKELVGYYQHGADASKYDPKQP